MGILIFLLAMMVHGKKRGFTSHHGITTAIECETGLVLDSDYLCTYCHSCNLDIDDHDYTTDYSGNVGSMEVYNI